MRRSQSQRAAVALALSLGMAPLLAQSSRISGAVENSNRITLAHSVHPATQAQYDRGRVDAATRIGYVTLMMKPSSSQQAALERLLEEQQDRSSPNYHRWLTPEQFGEQFGLSDDDYNAVVGWVQSQGLHVEGTARARNWVAVSGSAGQMENAFQTEIHRYVVAGQSYTANAAEVRIPKAFSDVVSGVRGLDDFWKMSSAVPQFTTTAGVHQLAPDDWATIYNVAPLYNMGIDGTGQRLVIVGRSTLNQSYVDTFRSMFGLPPSTIEQHLIGPDPGVTNAAGEAALDVEWSGAIARNATVVYVYSNNFNDAVQAAVDQNLGSVMSESLATCEPQSAVGNRAFAQQANAQGITFVASSGDSGPAQCDPHGFFGTTGNDTLASGGFAVGIPASFPEVTAIGGTQFNEGDSSYWNSSNSASGGSAKSYIPEVVWNETGAGGLLASGGGRSSNFPKPAWQIGPGVPDDNARDIPDISFSASGNHDPYIVVNANGQRATGGTSAGSPSFAGVVALLNQYLISKGAQAKPGLGNLNPELYRLARTTTNVFHDITQGNNSVPCAAGSPGCANGSMGFGAGPGYDLATGLGSVDVFQLFTAWDTTAASTSVVLTATPQSITLGDPVQLTATVAAAGAVPTGAVTFSTGKTILGTAPLVNAGGAAMATLPVTAAAVPVGNPTILATYSGDGNLNGSTGSTTVNVASRGAGSSVFVSITPNPAHEGQFVRITLTEEAGVATTITGWTINGVDDFPRFAADFGSTTLPAYGTLSTNIMTATGVSFPSNRVYVFAGMDADGRTWSQTVNLVLNGPLGSPEMAFSSAPDTVLQNPAADPTCQWSQQLLLQGQQGFAIQLTRFLVNGADWSDRIQSLFGTPRLAPMGTLQARVCWPAGSPSTVAYELDGTDQTGTPVKANLTTTLAGPASNPGVLSLSPTAVALAVADTGQVVSTTIALNLTGAGQSWTVSRFPSTLASSWLKVAPLAGAGPQQLTVTGSSVGLAKGVYNATLIFQAVNAIPQFIEVPVSFVVGASAGMRITGLGNGASYQPVFAPGMVVAAFGTQLAPSALQAMSLPLPLSISGVSATVNGVAAPLYYVSPTQVNLQIPYEIGAGPAVLGINNNGQVAAFPFTISPAAPGIFADTSGALVPVASAKRGDTQILFVTGEGEVSPSLPTGATPSGATPLSLLPKPRFPITMTIGGVAAEVKFAGIPPGVAGVSQINFTIPGNVPVGVQPVVVTAGGIASAAASLTILP